VTSGPGHQDEESADTNVKYRFEFWQETESNRPKRLILVSQILDWDARQEVAEIRNAIESIPLEGQEAEQAARNMRMLRQLFDKSDLVAVDTIDEEASNAEQARTIDEILEIFVRVNSGGTRLTRSDLMFSLIKTKWGGARAAFDRLIEQVDPDGALNIDKDFVIRGLLVVADVPVSFDVDSIERHWQTVEPKFDILACAMRTAIDFCREPEVGILSASLLQPAATVYPLMYYLSHQKNGSVPEADRRPLRTFLYFLLFNGFLRAQKPEARIRWLREVLASNQGKSLPLENLLNVIRARQRGHFLETTAEMLNANPRLALNIVQRGAGKNSLSWQAKADHIFPQSIYRERFPELVDDIGNRVPGKTAEYQEERSTTMGIFRRNLGQGARRGVPYRPVSSERRQIRGVRTRATRPDP
jgi:hypothetical protein